MFEESTRSFYYGNSKLRCYDCTVRQMMEAGASGYVMKNSPLTRLLAGVRAVAVGGTFFDTEIVLKDETNHASFLSPREKQILEYVGHGKTSQEIADTLFICKSTVDRNRKNILKKLNAHGKNDLVRFAIERKYDFDL